MLKVRPLRPSNTVSRTNRTYPGGIEVLNDFKKFMLRGNVVDLAVGVVIGAAFALVVTAFVTSFVTPLLGLLTGGGDLADKTFTLGVDTVFTWGAFLDALIAFILTAAVIFFFVVKPVNALMARHKTEPDVESTTKECPHCVSNIPLAATRCAFCTSEV